MCSIYHCIHPPHLASDQIQSASKNSLSVFLLAGDELISFSLIQTLQLIFTVNSEPHGVHLDTCTSYVVYMTLGLNSGVKRFPLSVKQTSDDWQPAHSPSASQHHSITASQASQHHSITASQHRASWRRHPAVHLQSQVMFPAAYVTRPAQTL